MDTLYLVIASFGFAFLPNLAFIPVINRLSHRFKWYDHIDPRKIHTGNIPATGGVGIFFTTIFAVVLFYLVGGSFFSGALLPFTRILPVIMAFLAIHITGIVDDFVTIRARYKLILQLLVAGILVSLGFNIKAVVMPAFGITLNLGYASYIITILWLAGISNAVNLMDGMDGLAGGLSAICALFYGIIFAVVGSYTSAVIAFAIFGAIVGFLFHNWPPAKIFMGDCGAIFIGFALAALPLIEHSGEVSLLFAMIPLSLLLVPILETFASIIRRVRRKKPIYDPDREHTHHKLIDFGISQRGILSIIYGLSAIPSIAVLIWAIVGIDALFWIVLATWVVVLVFFSLLDMMYQRHNNGKGPHGYLSPRHVND